MISVFSDVETPEQVTLILTSSFGMIGMNIVVFYLINDIVDRETQLYESRIFRIQAKNQAITIIVNIGKIRILSQSTSTRISVDFSRNFRPISRRPKGKIYIC